MSPKFGFSVKKFLIDLDFFFFKDNRFGDKIYLRIQFYGLVYHTKNKHGTSSTGKSYGA